MRQPPKTGARLYAPFQVNDAVLLCEGEKKTLAAYQAGFNAVGIGGVWNWLMHGELIEDLKAINWDGRECTIIRIRMYFGAMICCGLFTRSAVS